MVVVCFASVSTNILFLFLKVHHRRASSHRCHSLTMSKSSSSAVYFHQSLVWSKSESASFLLISSILCVSVYYSYLKSSYSTSITRNKNPSEEEEEEQQQDTTKMSFFNKLKGRSSQQKQLAERIAARVQERDSWSTWHKHTPAEVFQFLSKYKLSMPNLPSQKELDVELPVKELDWELLSKNKSNNKLDVTWIGHATCLVQLDGFTVLTDPVFSQRCAPTQFAGPARYRPTPCTISELLEKVNLDVVMVSHNHYDHLDYASIKDLAQYAKKSLVFIVPLGLKDWLQSYIPKIEDRHTIVELDWHETHSMSSSNDNNNNNNIKLDITAVPMQHWSSRRGYDRDQTLWCGFSMRSSSTKQAALFAGDTGWFEGAYDIGKQYGPYDVAMIPIGAYEPYDFMRPQHNNPKDAVHMMQAIQAKRAVPIHWGTFQLTKEHYLEPRERLEKSLENAGIEKEKFGAWFIGETVVIEPEA
jgi:N-acyl-phosphatidylethanolamine-hydrolysing phospholipase D